MAPGRGCRRGSACWPCPTCCLQRGSDTAASATPCLPLLQNSEWIDPSVAARFEPLSECAAGHVAGQCGRRCGRGSRLRSLLGWAGLRQLCAITHRPPQIHTPLPAVVTPHALSHRPASLPSFQLLSSADAAAAPPPSPLLQPCLRRGMRCSSTASNPTAAWTAPPCTPAAPSSGASSGQVGGWGGWLSRWAGGRVVGGSRRQAGSRGGTPTTCTPPGVCPSSLYAPPPLASPAHPLTPLPGPPPPFPCPVQPPSGSTRCPSAQSRWAQSPQRQ